MKKGFVYLVPTYLSDSNTRIFLAPMVLDIIKNTSFFLVENVRTARRFISSLQIGADISQLRFEVVNKGSSAGEMDELMQPVLEGCDVGVISESGLPALADPGGLVVAYAHHKDIRVVPLPGASSIQTALISSGFNGQQFTFHGYLPIQKSERKEAIKALEETAQRSGYTQIFMETPFRNQSLFQDLMSTLSAHTYLHISVDLFGSCQSVRTLKVAQWQKQDVALHKLPAVFCIGHFLK